MTTAARRYWAIRTDRDNKALLLDELLNGRLRQGWGTDANQDLRLIQKEIDKGGAWRDRLSESQKSVLPQLKMLPSARDGIQIGDVVLAPNLPEIEHFMLAEVVGEYYYEPLKLSREQDANELKKDYGHVLPIRLITKNGINKYGKLVNAGIRTTLKCKGRMWNLDAYAEAIEKLLNKAEIGEDLTSAITGKARLQTVWEVAKSHAAKVLHERLGSELDSHFQAAEWEEPIVTVLTHLYPGAEVRRVAGSQEHGADIVIHIPNYFGGELPWLIAVQVKNYTNQIDWRPSSIS